MMRVIHNTGTRLVARDRGLFGRIFALAFVGGFFVILIGSVATETATWGIAAAALVAAMGVLMGLRLFGAERVLAIDAERRMVWLSQRYLWGRWELLWEADLAVLRKAVITETLDADGGGMILYGVGVELADRSKVDVSGHYTSGARNEMAELCAAINSFVSTTSKRSEP